MITVSTDNSSIYSFLEDHDKLINDFESDHVNAFDLENDYYLMIYQAHNRDFILWKVSDVNQSTSTLISLVEEIELYEGLSVSITEKAIKLIEDRIISGSGSVHFFDAH
ncbi:MAG: hypothetical protein K0S44_536 [Bacteroidetes bacterium]|jgi:hypothetical protein|nr:hypothetical protein [Bacteroidota bacterium]